MAGAQDFELLEQTPRLLETGDEAGQEPPVSSRSHRGHWAGAVCIAGGLALLGRHSYNGQGMTTGALGDITVKAGSRPAKPAPPPGHSWYVAANTSSSGWAWDVQEVKFITADGVELGLSTPQCNPIDSAHANAKGYGPENVFKPNSAWWGGRSDNGRFYVGLSCAENFDVVEARMRNKNDHHFASTVSFYHDDVLLATKDQVPGGGWTTIWHGGDSRAKVACTDHIWWKDTHGATCASGYPDQTSCPRAHKYANKDGVSAKTECCVCGGGNNGTVPPKCIDNINSSGVGWKDSVGNNCTRYSQVPQWCEIANRWANKQGEDATTGCCVCGGGWNPGGCGE